MKICYFNGGPRVPSVRFRTPLLELLEYRGHDCEFYSSIPSRYDYFRLIGWRRSEQLRELIRRWHINRVETHDFDSVVLETEIFHTDDDSYERKLRKAAGRLVYEIDDAVFLLFPEKTQAIAEMADRVIAGNERIAAWARQYNQCVSTIPTCVDADQYQSRIYSDRTAAGGLVVGWIGSTGNVRMLSVCAAALKEVAAKRDFEFWIICSDKRPIDDIDLTGVQVRWVNIDRCNPVAELQKLDIGIMPLPDDDPWMEYKCNVKMIQYMAVAVPAIGSAIGFNLELVDHGVNSMLAKDHADWVQCLTELIDSGELRQQLGRAARETVLSRFTIQKVVDDYEQAVLGAKCSAKREPWKYDR